MYVDTVRLGVANPMAINNIGSWVHRESGHTVRFFGSLKLCPDVFDWATERDFFPGVPLGGLVVGRVENGVMMPYRAKPSNKAVRKPYLAGWGSLESWAGIKKNKNRFTIAVLDLSIKLWEELERLWERKICVNDLAAIPWHFYRSDPAMMGSLLNERWVDVIKYAKASIPA